MSRPPILALALLLALPGLATTGLTTPALAVPASFTVTGQVGAPASFDSASLASLPQSSQTVGYTAGGRPVIDTFTGPLLWSVVNAAGGIVSPAAKNGILQQYVVATGADGYSAVFSAGELSPAFGNRPDLVATGDALGRLPNPDGFARTVATGDVAGGRYVSNLASLAVLNGPVQPGSGGGPTTSLVLNGAVTTQITLTAATLMTLPVHTAVVGTDTYTGALLWDVLNLATPVLNPAIKNDVLRLLVDATGSDGYQADFALGEISPSFGNAPILVAYADTMGQIAATGFARIVAPGDVRGGRNVSNLTSLTVFDGVPTAVPEPRSMLLLVAALGLVAGVRISRVGG